MIFRSCIRLIILLLLWIGCVTGRAAAQAEADSATTTDYERLFEDKKSVVSKGVITLRKMDGKVYFEFPEQLLGKKMLLGAAVELSSNASDAAVSERPEKPICVYFTMSKDSTMHMRKASFSILAERGARNIRNALRRNRIGPILNSFEVEAVTPDSSALVFDATDIFLSDNKQLDPFGPYAGASSALEALLSSKTTSYKSQRSVLDEIHAYEKNVTVTSYLSFNISTDFLGLPVEKDRPATFLMKRTLALLPGQSMRPRLSDPRIGVASSDYIKVPGDGNGIREVHYAHRWQLQPQDTVAFRQGRLTVPAESIVFYIDDAFPQKWIPYVKKGVLDWNKAFKKIGFKNAIVTRMFPKESNTFDPNNIAYSTVNYVLSNRQNAFGQSWVDPRSGEILSASVYLYKGVLEKLHNDLFIQTAAANPNVRSMHIPDEVLGRAIRDVVTHQVGHSLGLTDHYGASASVPVDSLRSPTFTQRYGITPSVMDPVWFNFVARPGDWKRGVQMTPPDLGVYDYYAIKWLYQPLLNARTPADEQPVLDRWISQKVQDPMYRYHRTQVRSVLDPKAIAGDLGHNQIKATRYAIQNLKYVLKNMNRWVAGEDENYTFRTEKVFNIINIRFYWYLKHVLNNLGGIYQYAKQQGDPFPAYKVVPEKIQRKSALFLLKTLEDLSWMTAADVEVNSINGDAPQYLRSALFPYLMSWGMNKLSVSEQKARENPYTQTEFLADVFDYVWSGASNGTSPSKGKLAMQSKLVAYLIRHSPVQAGKGSGNSNHGLDEGELAFLQMGQSRSWEKRILEAYRGNPRMAKGYNHAELISGSGDQVPADVTDMLFYLLKESRAVLSNLVDRQKGQVKEQYQYLLMKVEKALQ